MRGEERKGERGEGDGRERGMVGRGGWWGEGGRMRGGEGGAGMVGRGGEMEDVVHDR